MSKKRLPGLRGVASKRWTIEEHLKRLLSREDFRNDVARLKGSIAMGNTLDQARKNLGILSEYRWRMMTECLGQMVASPEKLFMEFNTRHQVRYSQAQRMFDEAKASRDTELQSKMLLLLCKIDESVINLADKLGLLHRTELNDGSSGFDVKLVEAEIERIRSDIRNQLSSEGTVSAPIYIGSVSNPNPERQADEVGEPPVVSNDSQGQ